MFHSFAFDFSVWEIWGALLHGGRLVVVPYWVSRSPDAFRDLLRDERITVLNQTPSAFRQLIRADEGRDREDDPLSLRLVIFGGEALEVGALAPWFERHGDDSPRLVNMYGITETTVHVTYRAISAEDLAQPPGVSPIGRPIPDWQVYLLDRTLQPVPAGVVGEVYVGGKGLARGYLNRPALTAERFLPDPFGETPGARLYRSGDLARRRLDGGLEYVGRADHQVKVRGFRVELGEIEATLARDPGLREAVVLAREDRPGDVRLVAYLVLREGAEHSSADLRRHLRQTLPDYMVPSAFVVLEALPLTANGKLDRDALPAPGAGRPELDGDYVAPSGEVEEVCAAVWASVLGLERVGARDNFFELGGHSLLATRVISRLRDFYGVDLPLRPLFEDPTVAGLAEVVAKARRAGGGIAAPAIARSTEAGPAPLSFAQQALWFLDRLDPGRATFNVAAAVRIGGPLDLDALGRAFAEIVRRHESLRTTFTAVDGLPVQVVADAAGSLLEVEDLRALPPEDREGEARRLAAEEVRRPFDLELGPLVRARAIRLEDEETVVLLGMHHIVTDGWSFGVAAGELAAIYAAFREGRPSPLADLPIRASDFARWQRAWLQGPVLDRLLGYWTGRLAGLEPLDLPTDRPRPAIRRGRGATTFFELGAPLSRSLLDLGLREGVTPFMTLLAGFQALLHRLSGQDDIAVGSPIANRNRAETEGLIGYFVNMLVLRGDLAGDPSFRDLLRRTRDVALGAFEHQDLPFDRVVEAMHPGRDLSRTPLFQVMFVLQNNQLPDVGRDDLTLAPFGSAEGSGTAKFDLTLALVEAEGSLAGSLEYDVDLFDAATIGRMIARFRALLEAAVADPGLRLSDLPLATEGELALVKEWNRTAADYPRGARVHDLFEAQVARTPDAVALVDGMTELTYRDLDDRANRLARRLAGRGAGPGVAVGLLVERSAGMAAGILGILKAGAAYLPIDPAYPAERAALMLEDAGVPLLVTQASLADRLPGHRAEVVLIEETCGGAGIPACLEVGKGQAGMPAPPAPADPAYIIYTSGSTGRPRGVVVPHRAVVNHNVAASRLFGLRADDRVLQFSSIGFDIAVEELFPAWASGSAVVLRGGDESLDPAAFHEAIGRDRITVLDLPTAYWHAWTAWLASSGAKLPGSLRLVVVGGERALASALASWRGVAGSDRVRWINTYGPTEAAVIATAFEPGRWEVEGEIPIGRAIANARAYVLDERFRPMPPGLPGELYLGGEGVATGYLGRPGLTAEKFLPDPFATDPGARMFRTGDRARWRSDGVLEFLGRVDDQVKVRGFRVEPGEVEAALLALEGVRQAAVVASKDDAGAVRLVGYVVPDREGGVPAEIRRKLRETLPGHMVPAAVVLLEALPLTPSGKVDRRALPAPGLAEGGREENYLPPRDEVESKLATLWEDVLGVRPVGVRDNFFDLGGHSLLAIRLLSRVEEAFGRRLPLAGLFLGATVEDLAGLIRDAGEETSSPLVAIRPGGEKAPFFCVHPAGGIVYCFRELAGAMASDRPFLAFQAPGLDGGREPLTGIEAMAAEYVAAMRQAQPEGPYHLGGWSLGGTVAFEMARQLRSAGQEVATLALFDTQAPRGPDWQGLPEGDRAKLAAIGRDLAAIGGGGDDPTADAELLAEFAADLAAGFGGDVARMAAHFRGLDAEARRARIFDHFGIDRVYTEEAGSGRAGLLWAVLRSSLLAWARYRPEPEDLRVLLIRAADRKGADLAEAWKPWALGGVVAREVPGDHATMLRGAGVRRLAAILDGAMAEAEAR